MYNYSKTIVLVLVLMLMTLVGCVDERGYERTHTHIIHKACLGGVEYYSMHHILTPVFTKDSTVKKCKK